MKTDKTSNLNFTSLKINYKSMLSHNHSAARIDEYNKLSGVFGPTVDELDKLGYDLYIKGHKNEAVTYGIKEKGKSHYYTPATLATKYTSVTEIFNNLFAESLKIINEKISSAHNALGKKPR